MKSKSLLEDTTAVKSSSHDNDALKTSSDGDNDISPPTNKHLTIDEATEIALGTIEEEFSIDSNNSPYPEVRANVPNTDEVDLPVNTVRMWFLGVVFTMVSYLHNCHKWLTADHFCSSDLESISSSQ